MRLEDQLFKVTDKYAPGMRTVFLVYESVDPQVGGQVIGVFEKYDDADEEIFAHLNHNADYWIEEMEIE